ncbi:DNAj domain containing protein [Anaeramoeba flamelloides]|uniref:DNAj domain containing protein n=1 Tax=Anaeramoeba flamelloides TaxID=1746091 RepID=A0AAV7Z6U5_9EUKA|nr:DNAj domain containing protein [Anaeramoeba flamelloides]
MDHYQQLNLSRHATREEIKSAYKKMALLYHPDKVPEDKKSQAAKTFSKVNEAYHILSDQELRKKYDHSLRLQKTNTNSARFFETMTRTKKKKSHHRKIKIPNGTFKTPVKIRVPLSRSYTHHTYTPILEQTRPKLRKYNTFPFNKKQLKPTKKSFLFTLEQAYRGSNQTLEFERIYYDQKGNVLQKKKKKIKFMIPKGAQDGQQFTFERKGNKKVGIQTADLVITIRVIKHTTFKRKGDNLYITKKISLRESLSSFKFQFQLLNKKMLNLKFGYDESVVEPGKQLVLNGLGMPKFNHSSKFGDLIITFDVQFPKALSVKQKEMLNNTFSSLKKN